MAAVALMLLLWIIILWRLLADLLVWLAAAIVYALWGVLDKIGKG